MNINELKNKIDSLNQEIDEQEIISKIQNIMADLLLNFKIEVGNKIIKPIRVEAYFNRGENKDFDEKADNNEKQKNGFNTEGSECKLYSYRSGKRGRVDITLSTSNDMYFSLLLKNAIIDSGDILKQSEVANALCENNIRPKTYDLILLSENEKEFNINDIDFTIRKGICRNNKFDNRELAAFIKEKSIKEKINQNFKYEWWY